MIRRKSLVSPDIQDDLSGPTFQKMKELDELNLDLWLR